MPDNENISKKALWEESITIKIANALNLGEANVRHIQ